MLIEVGPHQGAIDRLVDWGVEGAKATFGSGATGVWSTGGAEFRTLQLTDGPLLVSGAIGGLQVLSNSRGFVRELQAVAAGQLPSLAQATQLGVLRDQLPARALASCYVNTTPFVAMLQPMLPYEASDFAAALGFGEVTALWAATSVGEQGNCDVMHLGIGGSEQGLAKALLAKPVELSFAAACSPNTVVFGAGSLDVPGVVDAMHRFAALLPASAREEMMRDMGSGLRRALREVGTSTEAVDGLLRALDAQVGFAVALEKGPVPKPELLLRLGVRDQDRLVPWLQRLEAAVADATGQAWQTRKVDAHDVRFVNLPLPEVKLQLSPCYVVAKDALWFGSDVAALVRALRQGGPDTESLASQDDFVALAARADGASGVLHLRWNRAIEIGWRSVESLVYPQLDARRDELGFGSEALPDAESLAAALGTSTTIYRVDARGFTLEQHGAMTAGAGLAAFGMLADEVLRRASGKVF